MKISVSLLILLLTILPASAQSSGNSATYSFVHISDTQYLAADYPETYDFTFSYLDSIRERYNISAIIITGDLVDSWNDDNEWDTYARAVHETSIPVYVIAGNHDTNVWSDYRYYTKFTGNINESYVLSLEDFDLVGINTGYEPAPDPREFAFLRETLTNSSKDMTIIAVHTYMDTEGTLTPLGNYISQQLIVKPSIILSGHEHNAFVRDRMIGQHPVIEDLTDYQDGIPGGSFSKNVSAGTFYTITSRDGRVEKISVKIIWISPRQSFDTDHVLYDITVPEPDAEPLIPEVTPDCYSVPGICGVPGFWDSLKELLNGFLHIF